MIRRRQGRQFNKKNNLATGTVFGRLTVIRKKERERGCRLHWECKCECGKIVFVVSGSLTKGFTKSCGCLAVERTKIRNSKHGATRGYRATPTYRAWSGMITRCTDKNVRSWPLYGGRGISVCDRWRRSFEAFRSDMGEKPEGMSIDRIDSNGHYEPGNCRWATSLEQGRNTSRNIFVTICGKYMCLTEACDVYGIKRYIVQNFRRRKNMFPTEALLAALEGKYANV